MAQIKVNNGIVITANFNSINELELTHKESNGEILANYTISQGDFVMLLNYYRYKKGRNEEMF